MIDNKEKELFEKISMFLKAAEGHLPDCQDENSTYETHGKDLIGCLFCDCSNLIGEIVRLTLPEPNVKKALINKRLREEMYGPPPEGWVDED